MSELRYHPFLDTWVITATHRQNRTFLPPADFCPLCPTKPGGFPTEIPLEDYDIAVFENRFPSLTPDPAPPSVSGTVLAPVRPSKGICEVVCYSSKHDATFATLPFRQVAKLARVWRDRYIELTAQPDVCYVFVFENKGKEIGVTMDHPHGQIYAYPFLPAVPSIELASEKRYLKNTGRMLMADVLAESGATPGRAEDGSQAIYCNDRFAAFVPFFARYPFEVCVAPFRHIASLADMGADDLDALADCLHAVARKYDNLFGFSLPYIMAMHQKPARGTLQAGGPIEDFAFNWFHVEFYPPHRTQNKLKYLAGSEAGAGAFVNDTLPEATAARLRRVELASPRKLP